MRAEKTCIYNAHIILPEKEMKGYILIEGNRISRVEKGAVPPAYGEAGVMMIDAAGCYVLPGLIDMHSDAIEKEMQPRPNTIFPIKMAFYELEKKLAMSGITTMYHSLSLSNEWGVRDKDMVIKIIGSINRLKKERAMINHKIHLRYELTFLEGVAILEKMIREKKIDLLSFMDHTPGQGQYANTQSLKSFAMQTYGLAEKEAEATIDKSAERRGKIDWPALIALAKSAGEKGIRLASHDDDTEEKIEMLLACAGAVSEFPVNLATALYAKSRGVRVCVGAPNIIRGKSHNSNMRAIEAIAGHAADIICSDYFPGSLLPSLFYLAGEGFKLTEAVKMATLNPAAALGIEREVGAVEAGKYADLLIVELYRNYPIVRQTLVGGVTVYQANYRLGGVRPDRGQGLRSCSGERYE